MKRSFFSFFRFLVAVSLLIGAVQPGVIARAQDGEPGTNAVTVEQKPPQPYANVWPGEVKPGYEYSRSFGETGVPYPANIQNGMLNMPTGLVIDAAGSLYAAETNGQRIYGFNIGTVPGSLLPWAPLGVAGINGWIDNPGTFINQPQALWVDEGNGYLWVSNWGYISIIDKATGALINHLDQFAPESNFWDNNLDCVVGLAVDTTTTPWQMLASETCNKNGVLVVEVENPYDPATVKLTVRSFLNNNNIGAWNHNDVQFIDLSENGNVDKRLFVAHDNGLSQYRTTDAGNDPLGWGLYNYADWGGQNTRGLALKPGDADHIYVSGNFRNGPQILRVEIDTLAWTEYLAGWDNALQQDRFSDPQDIVFDAAGSLYLSDAYYSVIRKFTGMEGPQLTNEVFFGTLGVPYLTPLAPENGHYYYNSPTGVALDPSDSIYILENRGQRLTKLSAGGDYQWSFGIPGHNEGNQSTRSLNWPQGNPAVDETTVFVPDWNNNRVLLLDPQTGAYMGSIGNQPDWNYQFNCPAGIALGPNGDIYVLNTCSNNVQVYDSNRYFRSNIGIKREWGSDNLHFNNPVAIAVKDIDTLLVADSGNQRIQECARVRQGNNTLPNGDPYYIEGWSCHTVIGVSEESGDWHPGYLGGVRSIVYDPARDRVLVGDNNGVMIYDGQYQVVGSISNRQMNGSALGMFSNMQGMALDSSGNLYVADWNNQRVDRFIPALSPLELAGVNGGSITRLDMARVNGQNYIVSNMGARLGVYSLASPDAPALVGTSALLSADFRHLDADGAYAYAMTQDDYLRIFSLAQPANPVEVSSLPFAGGQGLSVNHGWLFAGQCCMGGQGWNGPRLVAVDVNDPASPVIHQPIQTLDTYGSNNWYLMQIVTRYINDPADPSIEVYVALQNPGVDRYTFHLNTQSFTGPDHFYRSGPSGEQMVFRQIALSEAGDQLYALAFRDGDQSQGQLYTIDTASFTNLLPPAQTTLGDVPIFVKSNHVYLAGWQKMEVYDTADMTAPPLYVNSNTVDMRFSQLASQGEYFYSATGGMGLQTLTLNLDPAVKDDERAALVSRFYSPAGYPGLIAEKDGVVAAVQWDAGVSRFDASDPARVIETHQVTERGTNKVALEKVGGHLYSFNSMGAGQGMDCLGVLDGDDPNISLTDSRQAYPSDPGNPLDWRAVFPSAGAIATRPGATNHVFVYVIAVNNGVRVYDVDFTTPASPVITFVSDNDLGLNNFPGMSFAWYDHYLLLPNQNDTSGVLVVDVTDPADLQQVALLGWNTNAVAVADGKAYIFSTDNWLRVYDISALGSPSPTFPLLGQFNWNGPFWWPLNVTLKQFGPVIYAYFVTGGQMVIMDVSDPANMRIVASEIGNVTWQNTGVNIGNFYLKSWSGLGLYSYWVAPFTRTVLSAPSDVLDSTAVDGTTVRLDAPSAPVAMLYMPLYSGNAARALPDGLQPAGHAFELLAHEPATDHAIQAINGTYTVQVQYTDAEIAGLSESSLALWSHDGSAWNKEYASVVDAGANTVTLRASHFGRFLLGGFVDNTLPSGALTINNGEAFTASREVLLTFSGMSADVDRVRIAEDCPGCAWSPWLGVNANYVFLLTAGDGVKTVKAEIMDRANNIGATQDTITLDTTPPGGSISVVEASPTSAAAVHLNLSGVSDALSGLDQMQLSLAPDFSGVSWQPFAASPAFTLSGDGTKTIYARFKDAAGNISTAAISASVVRDATAPTGALLIIGAGSPTRSRDVTLVLTAADNLSGVNEMRFSESEAGLAVAAWAPYAAATPFTLSTPDGSKTVYAQVRDVAGNISAGTISAAIVLDTSTPSGSLAIASKPYASSATVNLALTGAGAAKMRLANTSEGLNSASWQNFAPSVTGWALESPAVDGVKTVFVQFANATGGLSPVYSDSTLLDTTRPGGVLYINGGLPLTSSRNVTLLLTLNEAGSGVAQYRVSSDPALTGAEWTSFTNPISFTLPVGDGVKTVFIQLRDNAGNETAAPYLSDTITLDSTAPSGSLSAQANAQTYATHQVMLALSATDLVTSAADLQMQVSNDPAFTGASWQAYQTSLAWTIEPGTGSHTVYARFRDAAGNISNASTVVNVKAYLYLTHLHQ